MRALIGHLAAALARLGRRSARPAFPAPSDADRLAAVMKSPHH
ncbi:hypothetical protein ACFVFI_23405 [Streptomyces sp. NPDC057705]